VINIISMTDLQKLSLKKLRKKELPLYVMDRKSKKGGFVIVDHEKFEQLSNPIEAPVLPIKEALVQDYRQMGLLWDQPSMTNEEFHKALKDPSSKNHDWVARRVMERVSSMKVKEILSLDELKAILSRVKFRPVFREPWILAINYWSNLEDALSNKMEELISRRGVQTYIDLFQMIPSHLTIGELLELSMKRKSGLDPLILAHEVEFILKSPPPQKEFLGTADWKELQLFFRKFQKECLDLIRP